METSYPLDDNFTTDGVNITEEIKSYLYETAKWGKFLSIVAFVFIGLIIIGMLIMLFVGASALSGLGDSAAMGGVGMGFMVMVYGIMIALYFFPTLYLYRFSTKMKIALDANDQQSLSESFMNMKSVFKFWGIFTAIIIGFYVLAFLGGIIFGGMGAFL